MNDIKTLNRLVSHLESYGLAVDFICNDDDSVAIAELSQHKILVNTTARDTIGMIFTIAHLFGHYIQFANFDKYKDLISKVKEEPKPLKLSQKFKTDFIEYEKEAFQIGKKLLLNVTEFTQNDERKYQIFYETDFDLFWDFLINGTRTTPDDFNIELKKRFKTDKKVRIPFEPIDYIKSPVYLHDINLIVY